MTKEVCPKCRGTGFASAEKNGRRSLVRCDCLRTSRSGRLMEPVRYAHCELEGFGLADNWRNTPRTFPDLDYRSVENKVTILTTNYLDQEDLKPARKSVSFSLTERIGESMRSRLYEMCKTVVMQGEDFRQKFKPDEHRL